MKLILDVQDPAEYGTAVNVALTAMRQYPNQKVGEQVTLMDRGKSYSVTRNQNSYTVKG